MGSIKARESTQSEICIRMNIVYCIPENNKKTSWPTNQHENNFITSTVCSILMKAINEPLRVVVAPFKIKP